jgi:hypothetical protein
MTYWLNVSADRDGGKKSFRPLLRLFIRETLKNSIFKIGQPHRQAQLDGVSAMIIGLQCTPDSTAFSAVPTDALD